MKKLLLFAFLFAMSTSIFSQKMAKDRYTVSGGLLGAMNYDKFRIGNDNTADIHYKHDIGWSAGGWLNLPLGSAVSFEPQVMYSLYAYNSTSGSALLPSGNLTYVSVPLFFKFHFNKGFALTAGGQADFLAGLDNASNSAEKGDFTSASFSASIGFEFLPHAPIVFFGRYINGLTNMDANDAGGNSEYFNTNVQIGVKVKLFGKMIPADTDGDGTPDETDKCPMVSGLAAFDGCPDTDGDGITDADDKCPKVAGLPKYGGCPIPDTDKDGVNDEVDKCPNVAGLAKYNGCPIPDSDNDGVNDEVDKCPKVAGLAKYNGCPIPDTDGDGVNDEVDKCPSVPGLAKYNGCPIPDRDKDGVNDEEDHCPDIPGLKDNFGCPKIESAKFTTQRIQFITGSATLTADAKEDIKEGAKLLNSNDFKMLKVEIRGHTDNTGNAKSNQALSEKRAKAVMAELAKDGVSPDRMTAVGYGQTMPIADNATKEGRTLNRRVAFDVRQ